MSDEEHMLYLLFHGGYARVVGENDKWTVAHQMSGESGRLLAAAPALLESLKEMVMLRCLGGATPDNDSATQRAVIAINKAEGRGDVNQQ